ncbi:uncharacterized protein LY89DRAFT_606147 [Mollisia scopiformis]|uniref:Uncharacterized protein n=1 Tax=Mollisia scopiformis TaxID=149040 RepID=A0A194XSR0_MOLSC|nr:uncharacterized protein LY89DRAFT_606147 [Mollisia scopiformis]KUJ23340.1 hypothetical protein LY89DRAFT_606147 [Mollisia scopiformis]
MKTPSLLTLALCVRLIAASIDRQVIVSQFNPTRYASSNSTPMQVGNGNFAFGTDVTGLQTFLPFGTLSSWGWHNFSLPTDANQTVPEDFTGLDWWTHGRLVNYDQPNPAEPVISNWLIQNPQRLNLGQVGFWFEPSLNVTEESLVGKVQTLDLYSGIITSKFEFLGKNLQVKTAVDPDSDTVSIQVESELLESGELGIFFDYPYSDVNKFDAPFVGVWNATSMHTTSLQQSEGQAQITHEIDATTYYTSIKWDVEASITGPENGTHRYTLLLTSNCGNTLDLSVNFSPSLTKDVPTADTTSLTSQSWWQQYWETGAFIDLTSTPSTNATELQRRIILSQYLLAVNSAGHDSPQESGLVSNGWYGKFHLEMPVWHLGHWARWGKWSLLERAIPGMYERFLPTSIQRAQEQGYEGARWGKMSDPTGRSAPGEINSLLIWQQPHVMYFAEMEYRDFPGEETLKKWDELLTWTAEFMVSFAWWNTSTGVYDLGPPMYPVSENTNPNATINPTFELAYWRFGLSIASSWKSRQNLSIPAKWTHVLNNLAPLPIENGTYIIYEGIPNMWIDNTTYYDHPAMTGIYGLLPPLSIPSFNLTIMSNTASKIASIWDFSQLFGWDFPMLAMNAAKLGEPDKAVGYLLDPNFVFDGVGMPVGGPRVATPYMPGSGSLLLAVAMMAGGWDGMSEGVSAWPEGWVVRSEGFARAM